LAAPPPTAAERIVDAEIQRLEALDRHFTAAIGFYNEAYEVTVKAKNLIIEVADAAQDQIDNLANDSANDGEDRSSEMQSIVDRAFSANSLAVSAAGAGLDSPAPTPSSIPDGCPVLALRNGGGDDLKRFGQIPVAPLNGPGVPSTGAGPSAAGPGPAGSGPTGPGAGDDVKRPDPPPPPPPPAVTGPRIQPASNSSDDRIRPGLPSPNGGQPGAPGDTIGGHGRATSPTA
jgi:hypothetical protein